VAPAAVSAPVACSVDSMSNGCWSRGEFSATFPASPWGRGDVAQLVEHLLCRHPGICGVHTSDNACQCGRRLSLTLAKSKYLYIYCLGQRGTARTGCRQKYVLAGDAEALVEDLYQRIQLPKPWVDRLTAELEAEIVERQAEASERRVLLMKTLAKLAEDRGKLLQAFYANAIPLDLLKTEQDRIGSAEQAGKVELETTEGDLDGWQDVPSNGHLPRRQLPRCVPEGTAVGAPPLQRRGARGRLHQGSQDRPGRVLRGLRASSLARVRIRGLKVDPRVPEFTG
jgi:hypothetical protein